VRAVVLYTGGKDSTYAILRALEEGFEIGCLLTILSENPESYMFHTINTNWTGLQAESMGLPLLTGYSRGVKEEELEDLRVWLVEAKRRFGVDCVVAGAVASRYQRGGIAESARGAGLDGFFPLWGFDEERLLRTYLREGFEILFSSVSALGLGEEWLGSTLTKESLDRLVRLSRKYRFNLVGEGGEYETFVLDAPLFRKRIIVLGAEKVWEGFWGYYRIKEAALGPKAGR